MTKPLSELMLEARGSAAVFNGMEVRRIFTRAIGEITSVKIVFRKFSGVPVQALRVCMDNGKMRVNGQETSNLVLWTDSSPTTVELLCKPKKGGILKIWNAWRDDRGTMHAWIGNSALMILESQNLVTLKCSDGMGDPDFDSLVVELIFSI